VRQLLADKISSNLVGLWLLVPEHLRLGTWDLLCGWSGQPGESVQPRLALQLVHEAALCVHGLRERRYLNQKGFELLQGLPFLASDVAVHELLAAHSVAEAQRLQIALGHIRRASEHYAGKLLAIDPHRVRSYSKRRMRTHRTDNATRPVKMAQTFWALDADTRQPVCFTTASSSRTVTQATPELLALAAKILNPHGETLVVADTEHFSAELVDQVHSETNFDLLVPMPKQRSLDRRLRAIPEEQFTRRWAGYATAIQPYQMTHSQSGPYHQFIQRMGETSADWQFNAFLATTDRDPVQALTHDFPKRWHVEEFFNANQALGWDRAGTANLNIRYGQMTMSLIAQAVIHQMRHRLGPPAAEWDARNFAKSILHGLEGDVRVRGDKILVTYYNAPEPDHLRQQYEGLPERLAGENIDPRIPWLYDYQLDFCFR
jgi:hypothetical protein